MEINRLQNAPELVMINNNLMSAIRDLKEQISFIQLMLDSLIESEGEEKVSMINKSINRKIYTGLLQQKEMVQKRTLQPNEPLDAKIKQTESIQQQIDTMRNDLIDMFGIGFVVSCEGKDEKWNKGKLIKI
jgi:hypothetical protein